MNASTVSALLAQRAEAVCRKYLPHGKKQGRYWCAGDARGARGRSLFVRLSPPGTPGKWTDAATGEHGDLLDLVRLATGSHSLREALAEARRFLAQPAAAPSSSRPRHLRSRRGGPQPVGPVRAHRRHPRRGLSQGPGHPPLPVPGIAVPSLAPVPPR